MKRFYSRLGFIATMAGFPIQSQADEPARRQALFGDVHTRADTVFANLGKIMI